MEKIYIEAEIPTLGPRLSPTEEAAILVELRTAGVEDYVRSLGPDWDHIDTVVETVIVYRPVR